MLGQGSGYCGAIDRDRRQMRLAGAKSLRPRKAAAGDQHIISGRGESARNTPAETAIAAKDEDTAQSRRDA